MQSTRQEWLFRLDSSYQSSHISSHIDWGHMWLFALVPRSFCNFASRTLQHQGPQALFVFAKHSVTLSCEKALLCRKRQLWPPWPLWCHRASLQMVDLHSVWSVWELLNRESFSTNRVWPSKNRICCYRKFWCISSSSCPLRWNPAAYVAVQLVCFFFFMPPKHVT